MTHGWRTGAILEEVEVIISNLSIKKNKMIIISKDEINVINSEAFQKTIQWVNYFKKKINRQCSF